METAMGFDRDSLVVLVGFNGIQTAQYDLIRLPSN